jgi:hypothetical protein
MISAMAATPRLQRLSEADLDDLIAELRQQATTELVLLGPYIGLPASVNDWPQELRAKATLYQFKQPVEALADRLRPLRVCRKTTSQGEFSPGPS